MDAESDDWNVILNGHPIFSPPTRTVDPVPFEPDSSLELLSNTLPNFSHLNPTHDESIPSGWRQTVLLKDADHEIPSLTPGVNHTPTGPESLQPDQKP